VTADHRRIGKCVVIGDKEVFTEEELQKVSTALKNNVRFYNDQDEIIEFKSYDNDYLTYYLINS
jgi:predicted Zn-dependent peptidase